MFTHNTKLFFSVDAVCECHKLQTILYCWFVAFIAEELINLSLTILRERSQYFCPCFVLPTIKMATKSNYALLELWVSAFGKTNNRNWNRIYRSKSEICPNAVFQWLRFLIWDMKKEVINDCAVAALNFFASKSLIVNMQEGFTKSFIRPIKHEKDH